MPGVLVSYSFKQTEGESCENQVKVDLSVYDLLVNTRRQLHKIVKHSQTIIRQIADKLFEYILTRFKSTDFLL